MRGEDYIQWIHERTISSGESVYGISIDRLKLKIILKTFYIDIEIAIYKIILYTINKLKQNIL